MSRVKLVVRSVNPPKKVGTSGAEVLEFQAVEAGKEGGIALKYGAWSKALYPMILDGATIDAEVEVKVSEKVDATGNPYQNRRVTQIYVDGQAVKTGGGGFGGKGFTPKDTESIERQNVYKGLCELMAAGKLPDSWNDLLEPAHLYALSRLTVTKAVTPTTTESTTVRQAVTSGKEPLDDFDIMTSETPTGIAEI
mgnify:CR=1 FL=1